MDAKPGRKYGKNAAISRAALPNDRYRELFDWESDQLIEQQRACRYGSMIQAVACARPEYTHWQLVSVVKQIMDEPGFEAGEAARKEEATRNLLAPEN